MSVASKNVKYTIVEGCHPQDLETSISKYLKAKLSVQAICLIYITTLLYQV